MEKERERQGKIKGEEGRTNGRRKRGTGEEKG